MIIPRVFGLVGLCRGFERADRQLLDAAALAGHLVTAGLHVRVPGRAPGRGVPGCGLCGPVRPPGAGQALPDAGQAGVVVVVAADVVMGSWLRRSSGRHLAGASNSSAQCGLERILELGLDQGGVQRVETKPPQTSTPSRADIWPRGPLNPITSCDDSRVAAAVTFGPSQVGPPCIPGGRSAVVTRPHPQVRRIIRYSITASARGSPHPETATPDRVSWVGRSWRCGGAVRCNQTQRLAPAIDGLRRRYRS